MGKLISSLRVVGFCLPVLLIALSPVRAAAGTADGAARFVAWLGDQVIAVVTQPETHADHREAAMRGLLRQGFDADFIGRFVAGPHYHAMSAAERDTFHRLFEQYLIRTYAARLDGYAGQQFTVLGARPGGEHDTLVDSRIDREDESPISAEWRIRVIGNAYRIIDVSIEGVSMAITHRSEFGSVITRQGVQGLLSALAAQVAR